VSNQVETHFVQQFTTGVYHLAQQMGSRLRPAVDLESSIKGDRVFFDQLDKVAASKLIGRHTDNVYTEVPHKRRMLTLNTYAIAELVNDIDKIKTLNDPTNPYAKAFANAMGRAIDDELISAAFADAQIGVDGLSLETWASLVTAGQQVAAGGTGLTIDKLLETKRIFAANEDDDGELVFVYSAKQEKDLLNTTEATSADYAMVKALVRGEIESFVGFRFIRSERLLLSGTDTRCIAFRSSALKLGIGMEITGRIEEIPTKNYETQVYYKMHIGATRMRPTGVIEVVCV
jgi:hypothetical protein